MAGEWVEDLVEVHVCGAYTPLLMSCHYKNIPRCPGRLPARTAAVSSIPRLLIEM